MQSTNIQIALIIVSILIIIFSCYYECTSLICAGVLGLVGFAAYSAYRVFNLSDSNVKYGSAESHPKYKISKKSQDSKTEIEAVFHNITADQFNHIRKILDADHSDFKLTNDLVELGKNKVRRITNLKSKAVIYQEKIPVKIEDKGDYKVRISSETNIDTPSDFQTEKIRKRERRTYKLSQFPDITFDLTIVQQDDRVKYEVEIETPEISKIFEDAIAFIKNSKFSIGQYINLSETERIVKEHNLLVSKLRYLPKSFEEPMSKTLISGYENKVSDLNVRNLLDTFWITLKYDGVRRMMFITHNGIYLIQRDSIFKIADKSHFSEKYAGTLIDGEFMSADNSYHMFDMLFYKSYDVTHKLLDMRLKYLSEIGKLLSNEQLEIQVYMKEYFHADSTVDAAKMALEKYHQNDMPYDGIIFQSTGPYFNKNSYKWKPSELLTIDFLVKDKKLWSFDGNLVEFTAEGYEPKPIEIVEFDGKNIEGQIVEFKWNGEFVPMRYREDRQNPNGLAIARKVWDKIHNPIPEATIRGDNLAIIRKFNQDEKMKLLNKYIKPKTNLVDIGSGQGADLHKWNSLGLNKVWIIDPDTEILKTLQERLSRMNIKYKLDILNLGAEETKKIKQAVGDDTFNIASFYSLTFFFKDKVIYKKLFETLNLLSKGGLFIGAVMDGKSTMKLLDNRNKFDNGLFSIEVKDVKLGEFGQKLHINIEDPDSMIKDLDEFLFDFDMFKQDVIKQKFELLEDYIPEMDIVPSRQKEFGSLYRYFAFKKI